MKTFVILLLAIICLAPIPAVAECRLPDLIYTSGEYELTFYQWDEIKEDERSATMNPFKITNKKTNITFEGVVGYGNGYSYPQVGIGLCAHKDVEYRKKYKKSCGYSGGAYEIDGLNTKYASFETKDNKANPILFPNLNVTFYYARNTHIKTWGLIDLPGDVWSYKGCRKEK